MNCPKCNAPLENTYRCPQCQYEEPTMKRIIYASNYHYNQGLSKARVRDLSGAADSLRMSLKYNKHNMDARNLLGLVYFQMGEIVDALSEWVISVHFKGQGNIARNYIKKVQNNPGQLQVINTTIQKYNLALNYLEEGNQDLAVIELKKVVNLNPNYIRAYQLLGLLYIKHKQYAAARKILTRALKLDRNNMMTVRYMNELASIAGQRNRKKESSQPQREVQIKDPNPIVITRSKSGYSDFNTGTLSFVNIIIGIIIGAAVVGLLLVPSVQKRKTMEYNDAVVEYSSQISDRNKQITTLQNQVDTLTAENDKLKNGGNTGNTGGSQSKSETWLIQAVKAYLDDDYSSAGMLLADIDKDSLSDQDSKDIYDFLLAKTKDTVSNELYSQAYEYYNNKDYMNAAIYFKKVLTFNPDSAETVYYLGRTYQYLTDFDKAKDYYNQVLEKFPDSDYAEEVKPYLSQIENRTNAGETSESESGTPQE